MNGDKIRNRAAGRQVRNASSKARVKSKVRQLVLTLGPNELSSTQEKDMSPVSWISYTGKDGDEGLVTFYLPGPSLISFSSCE